MSVSRSLARARLHVLEGGEYHVVSSGPVIELDQPFPLRLDVAALAL